MHMSRMLLLCGALGASCMAAALGQGSMSVRGLPARNATWHETTTFFRRHPKPIAFERRGDRLLFANHKVGLEFLQSKRGFRVLRLYSVKHDQDFLIADPEMKQPNLIQIVMDTDPSLKRRGRKGGLVLNAFCAGSTDAQHTGTARQATLRLTWKKVGLREEKAKVSIEVTVTLKAGDPFVYWRFALKNGSVRYGFKRVYFPVLNLAPIGPKRENVFIYPRDRGRLVQDVFSAPPGAGEGFHQTGRYPAAFGMQFQALYNKRTGIGLHVGTRDPVPHLKSTESYNHPTHITWIIGHWPPNATFADEDYALPFDCVTGPFTGDWWDACRIYREWAVKQSWCRKGPLATRADIPTWYKEAPLFLVTVYWGNDAYIERSVKHMLQYLRWAKVRLPCNVYAWKKYQTRLTAYDVPHSYWRVRYRRRGACSNVHDGNYPRLPALPGFSAACKRLKRAGGMMCPYVCLQIYDQGPFEDAPYAREARPHVVRDLQGNLQTYGREPSWAMCTWSPWWRNRLKETCVALHRREHAGGFYLDTMHGAGEYCYWTPHGHTAGGGSALPLGMHGLAKHVRDAVKAADPDLITTGEDSTENMIDVIDGKLYQYTLSPYSLAPLFAAVYQDYIPRYGMRLTPHDGEGFFMGAGSLFVEGAQLGRLRVAPFGYALSFDDPAHQEHRDYLGRLVSYYRQDVAKKFLCYGRLMRPLTFQQPKPMPTVAAKVPRWSHADRTPELPALLSGVFRARDGELGVFVVNISRRPITFTSDLEFRRHGLSSDADVRIQQLSPDGDITPYRASANRRVLLKGTLQARHITFFRLTPAH